MNYFSRINKFQRTTYPTQSKAGDTTKSRRHKTQARQSEKVGISKSLTTKSRRQEIKSSKATERESSQTEFFLY